MIRPVVGPSYYIGLNEMEQHEAVHVFPNPASQVLYINTPENVSAIQACIYDLAGRKALQETIFEGKINVEKLTDGMYFISIITEEGQVINKKIIIRK